MNHCRTCDLVLDHQPDRCPSCGERDWEPLAEKPAILVPVSPVLLIGPGSLLVVVGVILSPVPDSWRWN